MKCLAVYPFEIQQEIELGNFKEFIKLCEDKLDNDLQSTELTILSFKITGSV